MTDVLRLTLVSHGMTDAMAAGRFFERALDALGVRQCASWPSRRSGPLQRRVADLSVCSPKRPANQRNCSIWTPKVDPGCAMWTVGGGEGNWRPRCRPTLLLNS